MSYGTILDFSDFQYCRKKIAKSAAITPMLMAQTQNFFGQPTYLCVDFQKKKKNFGPRYEDLHYNWLLVLRALYLPNTTFGHHFHSIWGLIWQSWNTPNASVPAIRDPIRGQLPETQQLFEHRPIRCVCLYHVTCFATMTISWHQIRRHKNHLLLANVHLITRK